MITRSTAPINSDFDGGAPETPAVNPSCTIYVKASVAGAWIAIFLGATVLLGWGLQSALLTQIVAGLASMKPVTALAFCLAGMALLCRQRRAGDRRRADLAAFILSAAVVLVGSLTLAEYIFRLDLGIDHLLYHRALTSTGIANFGRMAPSTALAFILLGGALISLNFRLRSAISPADCLSLGAMLIGFIAILGYLYGVEQLYKISVYATMAVHTALLFVLLGISTLLARPDQGLFATIANPRLGGVATRRLLPVVIIFPVVIGWLRLRGQRLGWYGTEFGLALFAGVNVVILIVTVWINGWWLNRADEQLRRQHRRLQQILDGIAAFVALFSCDGICLEVNRIPLELGGLERSDVIGKPIWDTLWFSQSIPAQERLREAFGRAAAGHRIRYDEVIRGKGEEAVAVDVIFGPLIDENGSVIQIVGSAVDVTQRKQAEESLRKQAEELRALSIRLQQVREDERSTVARELHDQIGQAFTALKMDVTWLSKYLPPDQSNVRERVRGALALVGECSQWVKKTCTALRPGVLDDLGLGAALEWQAAEFAARTGIDCRVTLPAQELELDDNQSTALFRIFQEALTNVARHSGARSVVASVEVREKSLAMIVKDDGKGIRDSDRKKSFGLLGMRERAEACGGSIDVSGHAGLGTTVGVIIPLQR